MKIALLIAVVALIGNAVAATPANQDAAKAPVKARAAAKQTHYYEGMAALYAKWIDAANAIQNPDADIRAIWDAHWLRSLVIADRTDKRQINLTTGEELIAASYNRAINDVNVYVLAEARAAGQREAKAMTEHFERVEQARIEQERAEQLRQAEQRQINTLAVIQAINNAQLQQQEAAAETARRAAMLEFGLRLLSPPQQAPIQFPQPQMCSSYVNGRYISTRCW